MNSVKEIKIVSSVFKFEIAKGHLKWRVTDIARHSEISRTLIYYHFGKTKKEIFEHCFEIIMNDFYGLSPEREQLAKEGKLFECVKAGYDLFHRSPEFMVFYFYWRFKKSPVQARLIQLEKAYQQKLKNLFPFLSARQIQSLHSAIQGIVTSPFLQKADFELAIEEIIAPFIQSVKTARK